MGVLFIIITSVLAGLNLVAMKYGLKDLSPVLLMMVRFTSSALFLIILSRYKTIKDFKKLKKPLLISLYSSLSLLCIVIGVNKSTVSNSQAILAFVPVVVCLVAHFNLREKNTALKSLGLVFGLVGTMVIVFRGSNTGLANTSQVGDLLIFLSTLFSAMYLIESKKLSKQFTPFELILAQSLSTAVFFSVFVLASLATSNSILETKFTYVSILSLLYLIIFGTILCFYTYQKAIKYASAITVGLGNYIQLPVAILGGVILFGDKITWLFALGTFFIITCSFFGMLHNTRKAVVAVEVA
jgi:drug/metabolite transporter (DMT)-like permease